MKSNRSARRTVKTRFILLALFFILVVAFEFVLGEVLISRFGTSTAGALRVDEVQAPDVNLGDVFAAVP
jgi:hypothetical protein